MGKRDGRGQEEVVGQVYIDTAVVYREGASPEDICSGWKV